MASVNQSCFLDEMLDLEQLHNSTGLTGERLYAARAKRDANERSVPKRPSRDYLPPFVYRIYRELAEMKFKRLVGTTLACKVSDRFILEQEKAFGEGHVSYDKDRQDMCVAYVLDAIVEEMILDYDYTYESSV